MNNIKNYFKIIILFITIYFIFKYNNILNESVLNAVTLWLTKVFPSLFIMFIINDFIINTNILYPIVNLIKYIFNKTFNTNGYAVEAFILSIISGTPTIAFILKEMLNNNKIDNLTANKLIKFTFFSNPLFLYNILKISFNQKITIKIIMIHYLVNILIGLIYRNKKNNYINNNYIYIKKNLINILPLAIKKSLDTMVMILGTITFYMIVTNYITTIFPLKPIFEVIIKGIMEITQGLNVLNIMNNNKIKEILAISIISFGGLAIHTQVYTLLEDSKILYINFLKGRILHVLLATTTYILIP